MLPIRNLIYGKKGSLPIYGLDVFQRQKKNFSSARGPLQQYKTIRDIKMELEKQLGTATEFMTNTKSRSDLKKYMVNSQDDLPVRKMRDSFDRAIIPLSASADLRERYATPMGHVRLGRIMEDFDLFAGHVAAKHIQYPAVPPNSIRPYVLVTGSVDQVDFSAQVEVTDLRISGHVCWVGRSSLEVIVWLDQKTHEGWQRVTRALLHIVARNPENTGPALVNRVRPESEREEKIMKGGESRKANRLKMKEKSLLKEVPSNEELQVIHELFIKSMESANTFEITRVLPPRGQWMADASLNTLIFCHPEYRNMHNKIFGGFLIRQALELSWCAAYLYGTRVPRLIHISDIGFYYSVEVGSLLKLYASITYVFENFIQVFVHADAISKAVSDAKTTTCFHFTYDSGGPCDSLYPRTYFEALRYIHGLRQFRSLLDLNKRLRGNTVTEESQDLWYNDFQTEEDK